MLSITRYLLFFLSKPAFLPNAEGVQDKNLRVVGIRKFFDKLDQCNSLHTLFGP